MSQILPQTSEVKKQVSELCIFCPECENVANFATFFCAKLKTLQNNERYYKLWPSAFLLLIYPSYFI